VVSKIFQTGAAIYIAVVVARSTGPNRKNCVFRVLLRRFAATAWKRAKTSPPNFGENRLGCLTITTPRLTLTSSPSSFWRNTKWLSSPTHRAPLICAPCDFLLFPKMKLKLKWRWFNTTEAIQTESQRVLDTLTGRTYRKRSKNVGDGGTDVYIREGTTSRVMAANMPYGEF
jgi:hypothetical protein